MDYSPCVNSTEPDSIVCAPQEEIDAKLKGAYFAAQYRDLNINLKDYDNPDKSYIGSNFINFGSEYYTAYAVFV